jgi:cytochrome b6-f complex iron-sulfur subunit
MFAGRDKLFWGTRRRWFSELAWRLGRIGSWMLAGAAGVWSLATLRFMFPNTGKARRGPLLVGGIDQWRQPGADGRFKDSHRLWLVSARKDGRPRLYALDATCTHLGCQVLWDPTRNRFRCPCHGSEFSADGRNLVGPAVRPLIRYRLSLRTDGQLVVELAAPLDVSTSQTDPPGSFVVVPDEV